MELILECKDILSDLKNIVEENQGQTNQMEIQLEEIKFDIDDDNQKVVEESKNQNLLSPNNQGRFDDLIPILDAMAAQLSETIQYMIQL